MPRTRRDVPFPQFLWIWNHQHGHVTPPLHLRIARWLAERLAKGDHRLLLMAFRGAGKSTIVGQYCAWLLAGDPTLRILVLAADHALATKMVASVRRIIERHPLCRHLMAEDAEQWAADRFTVARPGAIRDPSMLAQGILGNITGARAEVIICDDVEVPNTADTEGKRADLRERLTETEFVLTPDGTLMYVGTPHTADSIYATPDPGRPPAFLGDYARLVIPLLDAAGRSVWPERFGPAQIARLRRRVGPRRFARQMLLQDLAPEAARLDPGLIARYRDELELRVANSAATLWLGRHRMVSGLAWWDPAFGRPGQGDASVLAVLFADSDGHRFLHRLAYLTHDPAAAADPATQQCRQVAALVRDCALPVVHVETNGIGRFLPDLLRSALSEARIGAAVREAASRQRKQDRILAAFDTVLAARRLSAHESVFATPFPAEMAAWRPDLPSARDDALDAIAGALQAEPARLPRLPPMAERPAWRG
jgi:hypothetical protein